MFTPFVFSETSPAAAGTAASSQPVQSSGNIYPAGVCAPLEDVDSIDIVAELIGATGGTLDVYLQAGLADGTWVDVVHFTQLAGGAAAVAYKTNISSWAQPTSSAPVPVGLNLTPALGANLTVQGHGFDRLRLLMVAGSGTSAGAALKVYCTGQRSASLPRH